MHILGIQSIFDFIYAPYISDVYYIAHILYRSHQALLSLLPHRTLTSMASDGSWMPFWTARRRWIWPSICSSRSSSPMSHRRSCMGRRSIKWPPLAAQPPVRPSRPTRRVSPPPPLLLHYVPHAIHIHILIHFHCHVHDVDVQVDVHVDMEHDPHEARNGGESSRSLIIAAHFSLSPSLPPPSSLW